MLVCKQEGATGESTKVATGDTDDLKMVVDARLKLCSCDALRNEGDQLTGNRSRVSLFFLAAESGRLQNERQKSAKRKERVSPSSNGGRLLRP